MKALINNQVKNVLNSKYMKSVLNGVNSWFSNDIGIDLGTANTLVFIRGQGIVLNEPSVVAVQADTNKVYAIGTEAKRMLGRTPASIHALRPMKEGVIANFNVTEAMLRYFIHKAKRGLKIYQPRVLVAVPSGITEVERRAVEESAEKAGARIVHLIEEPKAAAIGAGLPVQDPTGNMIADIGGGTTEVAVLSLGGIVGACSIRVGGDNMDEAITRYIKRMYNLIIGERTAEIIKIEIGSACPLVEEIELDIKGRDLETGLPKTITINSVEIRESLREPLASITDAIRVTLERCPPELSSDLIDHGIILAGGGALLRGIDQLLANETHLPVVLADDPIQAVANGTGIALEGLDFL